VRTEEFSKKIIRSGLLDTYVAAVFFGTSVFFVLNSAYYTPIEMMFAIVFVTVLFKGLANVMLSMSISLVNLKNDHEKVDFEESSSKLESLVNDLAIQEAAIQSHKTINSQ